MITALIRIAVRCQLEWHALDYIDIEWTYDSYIWIV